jgi:hypothetical protein
VENPYEKGNSSMRILEAIKTTSISNILKKEFYNLTV